MLYALLLDEFPMDMSTAPSRAKTRERFRRPLLTLKSKGTVKKLFIEADARGQCVARWVWVGL